ncbi:MAG TPA: sulfatase-like hydrolase/transferase [Thermoanaerobaculia bacterium]|jgi:arylsulfatase A-like enzyme|nr:sulfatase-like hydrolase/transferase [Thermoanaerobaculia bacterium]
MPKGLVPLAWLLALSAYLTACQPAERRHFERGEIADRADRRQEAEREYRAALAANADYAPAYMKLSRLLVRSGKLVEVLAVAREGVRRFPRDPQLRAWYGDALLRRDRLAEAERELRQALTLARAGAYPRYTLGLVYLKEGRTREGREQLEQATRLQPSAPEGWYQLANACDRLGEVPARDRALARFAALYAPPASPSPARVTLPVAAGGAVRAPRPAARRPNLILLSIDTLRADRLGCYGGPHPTSPAIDAMAREGTRFANAYSAAPWTLPSHMTMMTGLYASAHGVNPDRRWFQGIQNSSESFQIRGSPRLATLAERLSRLGYRTSAITEGGWVAAKFGFDQGFNSYVAHDDDNLDAGTQKLTLDWLAAHAESEKPGAEQPFFLFVHTYQVHQPYHQPPPYDSLFVAPGHRGYALPGVSLPMAILDKFKDGSFPPTAADAEAFRARYDGEVRHTDAFVGRLLAALRAAGLDRDTIVLLTSDHGEELFDHGGFDHGDTLYDEALRVPMILWGPGRIPPGKTVAVNVGSIDVLPSLVELAGGTTTGPNAPPIQGESLVPLLSGQSAGFAERSLFAETFTTVFHHTLDTDASIPLASAREGSIQLIVHRSNPDSMELFDLGADPAETRNLAAKQPETVARLRRAIQAWQSENARLRALYGEATEKLDPETEKRLKALGYL